MLFFKERKLKDILQNTGNCVKKTTFLCSSQVGQRILCNNTTTINTQAKCQQLIMSDLCQDGADEIILLSFYIWPSSALTSSLMLTGQLLEGEGSFKPRASFCMNECPFFHPCDSWISVTTSR